MSLIDDLIAAAKQPFTNQTSSPYLQQTNQDISSITPSNSVPTDDSVETPTPLVPKTVGEQVAQAESGVVVPTAVPAIVSDPDHASTAKAAAPAIVAQQAATPAPSQSQSDEGETSEESAPATATQSSPPLDAIKAQLAQKFGFGSTDNLQALQAAQQRAVALQANANLGDAFATIANGLAGGKAPLDNEFFQNLGKQGQQQIQNVLQQRALQQQDLQNAGQIDKLALEQMSNDPNSPINQSFRNVLGKIPALKDLDLSGVTVANAGPFQKVADAMLAEEAKKLQIQSNELYRQALLQNKIGQQNVANTAAAQKELNTDKQYTEGLQAQDAATKSLQDLENARTNPVAYSLLPMEVIRGIVKNRVSNQEMQYATGGRDLNSFLQRVANTGANGTITDRDYSGFKQLLTIAQSRAAADMQAAIARHTNQVAQRLGTTQEGAQQKLLGKQSNPQPAPQSTSPTLSPEDVQAITWAKANPSDPRAAKILQLHGMQ